MMAFAGKPEGLVGACVHHRGRKSVPLHDGALEEKVLIAVCGAPGPGNLSVMVTVTLIDKVRQILGGVHNCLVALNLVEQSQAVLLPTGLQGRKVQLA